MTRADLWMKQISASLFAGTWVDDVARQAPEIVLDAGLGNPARKYNKAMVRTRNNFGLVPRANFYGKEGGVPQLVAAISQFSRDIDGVDLTPEQILVSETGSCPILGWLAEGMQTEVKYLDDNGVLHVLVAASAYGRHLTVLDLPGVKIHLVDFYEGEANGVSFAQTLEEAIKNNQAKLVVLSSVFNPSTRVMTEAEVRSAVTVCAEYGVVLFMDDAYRHVYRERRGHIASVLALPEAQNSKVVATLTASKAWQSPCNGGAMLGCPELVRLTASVRRKKSEGGNIPVQLGWAATMLDYGYLVETRRVYDSLESEMVEAFRRHGWGEFPGSEASIFICAPIPARLLDRGWNADRFARACACKGVIFYPNMLFPGSMGEWVRICMRGTSQEISRGAEMVGEVIADSSL